MSVTDGTLNFGAPAEESVRVVGTVNVNAQGGGTGGATETQIVGANGTSVADVSASGNLFVEVSNTSMTVDQGTAAAIGSSWPIKITDGTDVADIALPGANIGAGLVVSSGAIVSTTTLNAVSAVGNGTAVDFGAGKQNVSLAIIPSAGVSAGVVALEGSQDGTNWIKVGGDSTALSAGVNQHISVTGIAFRHFRGVVTTTVTGGTVTATLMAS